MPVPEIVIQSADGNREHFSLEKDVTTIGRSRESDIFLPDQWLSRHHAEIRRKGEAWIIVDLNSKNGTLLSGQPAKGEVRLRPGDVITLGEHTLTYTDGGGAPDEPGDKEPEGTRVFSARELSDISTKPAIDPQELARQNRVLTIVSKATSELVIHKPLSDLFELILTLLFEAVPAERGAIVLLESEGSRPEIKAVKTRAGRSITHVSRAISRRVLKEKVSLLLPKLLEDKEFNPSESILSSGIRSAMCAPLWYSVGGVDSVLGLVYLDTLEKSYSFSEEDLRILTALSNVAAAKIENTRLLDEMFEKRRMDVDMLLAAEMQRGLLPREAPVVPGYGLVGKNIPCRTVGGDYYDFTHENGRVLLALGDVAGKGVSAAPIMAVVRAAVRDHWSSGSPAETVARLNRTVCKNVPDNKYVTFFHAALDPATGNLAYVNAGHNPPVLVHAAGPVETLGEGGTVLGIFETASYTEGTAQMRRGDTLLIYSDGISETFDPEGNEFGEKGLAAVARRASSLDAAAVQDEILRELERFSLGAKATDDRTLIVVKRY